jgi:filamentous hemagglutinin family protein
MIFGMRTIHKGINLWFEAFLLIFTTGLFTPGMMLSAILLWSGCANAQVTSDDTTNTLVNQSGNNFNILNGLKKGNNLFHSFSNFSVPAGASTTFDLTNTPNITTIFSRVTGGNVSNINGLINTLNSNNPVSLFLMNPAGIVFGKDASLNIGGSFVGTTASSIKFADGTEFNAVNLSSSPLLTMSVPIGLQMGTLPGKINIQGNGHKLTTPDTATPVNKNFQLQVASGKTLSLVGGDVTINGGILTANQGNLAIASLGSLSSVILETTAQGWHLSYPTSQTFQDIVFAQRSLLDVSGIGAGSIQLQGRNISLEDGSIVISQNRGTQTTGSIQVNASDRFTVQGATPDGKARSLLVTEALGSSKGGNISITTTDLIVAEGGAFGTKTLGTEVGGNIDVQATNSVQILGYLPRNPSFLSSISAATFSSGQVGNIQLTTNHLSLKDGGALTTATIGQGKGGNIGVNAVSVELIGASPQNLVSTISASSLIAGDAGNVTINTKDLDIQQGAVVAASSFGKGNAGTVLINATEGVNVTGVTPIAKTPSQIRSAVLVLNESRRQQLRLPVSTPSGEAGNVLITAGTLNVADQARITVENVGSGKAGNLTINSRLLEMKQEGKLLASTASGLGGNIVVNLENLLTLQNRSTISTEANGVGNGGNITINAPIILGMGNADIIANAVKGHGGNIQITTQGIFGFKYSDRLTPENDITASSEFGVNGTVDINNFGVDPSSGLVELSVELTDPSRQIATGCSNNTGSSFVATGRGGIPQNPTQEVRSDAYDGLRLRTWSDIRNLTAYRKTGEITAQMLPSPEVLVQATSWHRNADGKIELITDKSSVQVQQVLNCAAVPKN